MLKVTNLMGNHVLAGNDTAGQSFWQSEPKEGFIRGTGIEPPIRQPEFCTNVAGVLPQPIWQRFGGDKFALFHAGQDIDIPGGGTANEAILSFASAPLGGCP